MNRVEVYVNRSLILAGSVILMIAPAMVAGSAGDAQPIGVITGSGNFVLDNANVNGNASLLEGSVVQTMQSTSAITLNRGGRIELAPQSAARVYADRLKMEKGIGETRAAVIQFGNMWVQPEDRSLVQVVVEGSKKFQVAALSGPADVRTAKGVLIARVMSGHSLELTEQDQQGATGPSQFAGCIQRVKVGGVDHYVLRDETTNVVIEVSGPDVAANVGKAVQVTGAIDSATTPIQGASQFVQVTALTPQNRKGCRTDIAAAAAAAGVGGAVAGLSTAATVAIVGGVAAAATIGGLAASGEFSGGASAPVSVP